MQKKWWAILVVLLISSAGFYLLTTVSQDAQLSGSVCVAHSVNIPIKGVASSLPQFDIIIVDGPDSSTDECINGPLNPIVVDLLGNEHATRDEALANCKANIELARAEQDCPPGCKPVVEGYCNFPTCEIVRSVGSGITLLEPPYEPGTWGYRCDYQWKCTSEGEINLLGCELMPISNVPTENRDASLTEQPQLEAENIPRAPSTTG
jgi:hypothetical protein